MLQLKSGEYVGVLYDFIEEVAIERSPIIRATWDEAMADARALVAVINAQAEAADDEAEGNTSVGRVDDSYCYVQGRHGYENEDDKADREYDEHTMTEQMRAEGRLPGYDDTPSLPASHPY